MLFTPPPGYSPSTANRQTIPQRGAPGIQSVLAQPPPAFPGAAVSTGGVSASPSMPSMGSYGHSSFSMPSSYLPSSSSPVPQASGRMPDKANMQALLKLLGGRK